MRRTMSRPSPTPPVPSTPARVDAASRDVSRVVTRREACRRIVAVTTTSAVTRRWTTADDDADDDILARAADDAASFYAEWSYSKPSDVVPYVERYAARGDPASVLRAYDDFGERFPTYKLGAEKAALYGDVLAAIDPTTVIEIGTFLGYSAIATAMRFTRDEARLLCVEYEERHAEVARWAVEYAGLADRVTVLTRAGSEAVGEAKAFVESIKGVGAGTDVLFLDHAKERYLPDLKLYEDAGVVRKGTTVVADNVVYPGAPGYLEYVDTAANRYETRLIDAMFEYDQVWKKDWKGTPKDALSVSVRL